MSHKQLFALLAVLSLPFAGLASVPLGTAFTYQGQLQHSNKPVSGPCDFQFSLWDAAAAGSLVGATQQVSSVSVSNGQFTVVLDFGPAVFTGDARWLDIALRLSAGAGDFTSLAPRQPLTATPYALLAATAAQVPATNLTGLLSEAQMPTNVVWLNRDQVFTGVNILNNPSNQFVGQFIGDGAGLRNINVQDTNARPMNWTVVSNGSRTAFPNNGYLASGETQVTITLPNSATLAAGDVVRISGAGAGGWKIVQSDNQTILTRPLGAAGGFNWDAHGPTNAWRAVVSSADGIKLAAVPNEFFVSGAFTSTNSGVTWTSNSAPGALLALASSADGNRLVACAGGAPGGPIWTTTNAFATWPDEHAAIQRAWTGVASSADGSRLVAVARGSQIYTSTDYGASWTAHATSANWLSVASSADGTRLIAGQENGQLYTSINGGLNWSGRGPTGTWAAVASSADGSRLVAGDAAGTGGGRLYVSADYGATWTARSVTGTWTSLASSADGSRLFAVEDGNGAGGRTWSSIDYGATWAPHGPVKPWRSVACSTDGGKVVAAESQLGDPPVRGRIFTSGQNTTIGTGGLIGDADAAVELQYIGNDRFRVLSHEGTMIPY